MARKFEELNVLDDFLINAIASDPEVGEPFCRTVLSVLLQKQIEQTEDVELLGKWHILAVKSGSIPRFLEKIKNE